MCLFAARRAAISAGAALTVLAGVVGGAPAGAQEPALEAGQIVEAINLTPADLPGWRHEAPPTGHDVPTENAPPCRGLRLREAEASGSSEVFMQPRPVEVHSAAWVLASAADAAHDVAMVRSAGYRRCVAGAIRKALGKVVRVTKVSVRSLGVHPPSTAGIRMRVGASSGGRHVIAVVDHRWFAYDRVAVCLESSTVRNPFSAAQMDALQGLLFQRAQAAIPGG